jgi:hypothetical protein
MLRLPESARGCGRHDLASILKQELEALDPASLPLQAGLRWGSHVAEEPVRVTVIRLTAGAERVLAKVGVMYGGVIAGCSCADDPTPLGSHPEYCELELIIELPSGLATVGLCP